MVLILECIVVCFILLVPCVAAIANGTENAAFLFEKEVEERVLKIGLITEERLEKNRKRFRFWGLSVMIAFILFAVYGINGARGFRSPFWQIYACGMAEGLFDRLFIDCYWVGHTRAWIIPGTEDLMPYIPRKTVIVRWLFVIAGTPLIAAALSGIMLLFLRG
jgi:hypothetical protein